MTKQDFQTLKKAKALTYRERATISDFCELHNNAGYTHKEIAAIFSKKWKRYVSPAQVQNCMYKRIDFSKNITTTNKVLNMMKKKNYSEQLVTQKEFALTQLAIDENVNALDRIAALKNLAYVEKQLQEIEIESHIKRADAGIIASIIRRFLPEASDNDIIKIYSEEFEKWKHRNA